MSWRERYADKLVSAQEAASHIRSGDTVLSTMFSSVPYALIEELGARCPELENVNIYMGFGGGIYTPIVTEYGIADLKYQALEERAKRLIAIAHPDFRDELTFEAKKLGLLY